MKILVTGAAGYIGKQLIEYLYHQNTHEIIAFDIRDDNPFAHLPKVSYTQMDIRSDGILTEIIMSARQM